MKHLKNYLKKSKLTRALAILVGLLGKFSMGYFSTAVNAYTEALIKSYSKEVIDKGVSNGIINLLDGKSLLNEVYDENGKVSYAYLDVQILNYLRRKEP